VGHEPQAQLAVPVVRVFVELAAQADVREVAELDHARAARVPVWAALENGGGMRERSACMDEGGRVDDGRGWYTRRGRPVGSPRHAKRPLRGAWRNWRRGGDSNPRGAINACLISSQVHSTTLPPL